MLLTATDDDDDNDETDASHGRHLRDMSNISTLSMDEAWLEVEALEKVALLSLHIETTETSLGSVQSGESTLGVSFDHGVFQGAALFGREGQGTTRSISAFGGRKLMTLLLPQTRTSTKTISTSSNVLEERSGS